MNHGAREPICGFNAVHERLSMSSGPHPCFPLLEMVTGLTGAHHQL